jgi:hypothetical protein
MLAVRMEQPGRRQTFNPAGAGGLLLGTTGACMGIGALVGWALGATGIGLLVGAIVGIPLAVFAVYRRYRGAFT